MRSLCILKIVSFLIASLSFTVLDHSEAHAKYRIVIRLPIIVQFIHGLKDLRVQCRASNQRELDPFFENRPPPPWPVLKTISAVAEPGQTIPEPGTYRTSIDPMPTVFIDVAPRLTGVNGLREFRSWDGLIELHLESGRFTGSENSIEGQPWSLKEIDTVFCYFEPSWLAPQSTNLTQIRVLGGSTCYRSNSVQTFRYAPFYQLATGYRIIGQRACENVPIDWTAEQRELLEREPAETITIKTIRMQPLLLQGSTIPSVELQKKMGLLPNFEKAPLFNKYEMPILKLPPEALDPKPPLKLKLE